MSTGTYTVFCQDESRTGTMWIEAVEAGGVDEAAAVGRAACADAWEYPQEMVVVVGVAEGDVRILFWEDGE